MRAHMCVAAAQKVRHSDCRLEGGRSPASQQAASGDDGDAAAAAHNSRLAGESVAQTISYNIDAPSAAFTA